MAQAGFLLLPVLGGAAASGLVQRFDLLGPLQRPIDGGARWRGRRVFGDNKTWRGLASSAIGCTLTVAGQRRLLGRLPAGVAVIDYARVHPAVLGSALAAAAITGELPNSFAKRRLGVPPGAPAPGAAGAAFYVWDQVDFLFTVWPVLRWWVRPSRSLVLATFGVAAVAHQLLSLLGYAIGARPRPFT